MISFAQVKSMCVHTLYAGNTICILHYYRLTQSVNLKNLD